MSVVEAPPARERSLLRQVALPAEHGGWGLTLEPVLLGLLVAHSWAGAALGVAAFASFLVRTPLKLAIIDRRRRQWAARSRVAANLAAVQLALIVVTTAAALALAGPRWLLPVAIAVPFVAVELWFDVRSRGRRLIPELCGAVGIAAAVAAIIIAAGKPTELAAAMWLILAGRSVAAIPFVRVQIMRLRRGVASPRASDGAQVLAVAVGVAAVVLDRTALLGAVGIVAIAAVHGVWVRRPAPPAKLIGMRQMALGLALVALTSAGAWAA